MSDYLERSKTAWKCAGGFPANKEEVYPAHKLYQEFDLHHDKVVYEYGCGGGSDVMSYLQRGNHVTATDIVPENLAVTRERIIAAGLPIEMANLVLLQNSHPLPFEDNSFDIVSSHGVLHHCLDPEEIVRELFRVTKPGGLLYTMMYTEFLWEHHKPTIDRLVVERGLDPYEAFGWCTDGEGTPYARPYTTDEWCLMLEEAGFTVLDYNHWLNEGLFCTYKAKK